MSKGDYQGKRAVIFARESVYDPRQGTRSTDEQVAESRAWCDAQGVTVAHVRREENTTAAPERLSGRRKVRDIWNEVKRLIADGDDQGPLHILVTWSATRAQRDLDEYVDLRRLCAGSGVLWCYGGRVHDMADDRDRFSTAIDVTIGERQIAELRNDIIRAHRANAAKGRPHGHRAYGYVRRYHPETGALVAQVPQTTEFETAPGASEATTVQRIYREYLAGRSITTIIDGLIADRIPTGGGHTRWSGGQVSRILRSRVYIAERTHNGAIYPADWPPLVTRTDWDRVQERIAARRTRQGPRRTRLLSRLARCAVCGTLLESHTGKTRQYRCRSGHVARDTDRLDTYVTAWVLTRLARPDAADELAGAPDPRAEQARQRIVELRAELDEAMGLWKAKKLTVQGYAAMEADLLPQIAEAERAARSAAVPLDIDVPPADGLGRWWHNELTQEVRREIAAAYIAAVIVQPVGRGRRHFDMADYTTIERRR